MPWIRRLGIWGNPSMHLADDDTVFRCRTDNPLFTKNGVSVGAINWPGRVCSGRHRQPMGIRSELDARGGRPASLAVRGADPATTGWWQLEEARPARRAGLVQPTHALL